MVCYPPPLHPPCSREPAYTHMHTLSPRSTHTRLHMWSTWLNADFCKQRVHQACTWRQGMQTRHCCRCCAMCHIKSVQNCVGTRPTNTLCTNIAYQAQCKTSGRVTQTNNLVNAPLRGHAAHSRHCTTLHTCRVGCIAAAATAVTAGLI